LVPGCPTTANWAGRVTLRLSTSPLELSDKRKE
jgi:hypothetical protein